MASHSKWWTGTASLLLGFLVGLTVGTRAASPIHAKYKESPHRSKLFLDLETNTNPLIESSRRLTEIAKLTSPSVVHIQSYWVDRHGDRIEETGSGVIFTSEKKLGHYIVTNRHVVKKARRDSISIFLNDGRVIKPRKIWTDPATDLAVMRVMASNLQPARWGDSDKIDIGNIVLAMGSPFGLTHSLSYGIISAKSRRSLSLGNQPEVLNQDFLQTDAAINPGSSGGPLIDLYGKVIGINTAIASHSGGNDGIGFSIPSRLAKNVFEQLITQGEVKRSYLGVMLDPHFSLGESLRLKLDRIRGARITLIYADTPAESAGLKIDDVVLKFNGEAVQDENHLINLVSMTPIGTTVNLEIWRDGRRIRVAVKLFDRKELEDRS